MVRKKEFMLIFYHNRKIGGDMNSNPFKLQIIRILLKIFDKETPNGGGLYSQALGIFICFQFALDYGCSRRFKSIKIQNSHTQTSDRDKSSI